jgi:hypothetical protein
MNKLKGQRVEVLDTLTNETTIYTTIREVGRALGCTHEIVRRAMNHFKEKGEPKLILKRYKVYKPIND